MKKILLSLFLLFAPFSVSATEILTIYEKFDLHPGCFKEKTEFTPGVDGTVKIKIKNARNLTFVEGAGGAFALSRIFDYGQEKEIDYKVLSGSGAADSAVKYLQDGNPSTNFVFDAYSRVSKELVIDVGSVLQAKSFVVRLDYQSNLRPVFFVSKNNQDFIRVIRVEDYDWRYLKIVFEKYSQNDAASENLSIQDLSIVENGAVVYLLKPKNKYSKINIYADYRCAETENLRKALNEAEKLASRETFAVDAKTKVFGITLIGNPDFNNDFDRDDIVNDSDNCPFEKNNDQADADGDLAGDVCDFDNERKNFSEADSDKDGVGDSLDNCPYVSNVSQLDSNADKVGDFCADDDGDGIPGYKDNCKDVANANQKDININGVGDACEFDKDEDSVFDSLDNCLSQSNIDQEDADNDTIGDACDNCNLYNPQQIDANNNSVGDVCEEDAKYKNENDEDRDGILNAADNCRKMANEKQEDVDNDGVGDACDNCRDLQNTDQRDENKNNIGDLCEDVDEDGVTGYLDNCQYQANAKQEDKDNDSVGDVCEDDDADGVLAVADNCPLVFNKDQGDVDGDKIGDVCDSKDDRLIESNKTLFIGFIVIVALIFLGLIWFMMKRMREDNVV